MTANKIAQFLLIPTLLMSFFFGASSLAWTESEKYSESDRVTAIDTLGDDMWNKMVNILQDISQNIDIDSSGNIAISNDFSLNTDSGKNAEINLKTGEKEKWAIYHDETSEELRFWNVQNIFSLFADGTAKFSGNIVAETAPLENSHLTNKEYVDSQVSAGNDWQVGKTCSDGEVFAGYNIDKSIKCSSASGSTTGSELTVNAPQGLQSADGSIFSVGGNPHYCQKVGVTNAGVGSSVSINNYKESSIDENRFCFHGKSSLLDFIEITNVEKDGSPVWSNAAEQICIEAGYTDLVDFSLDSGLASGPSVICDYYNGSPNNMKFNYRTRSAYDFNNETWELLNHSEAGSQTCSNSHRDMEYVVKALKTVKCAKLITE